MLNLIKLLQEINTITILNSNAVVRWLWCELQNDKQTNAQRETFLTGDSYRVVSNPFILFY